MSDVTAAKLKYVIRGVNPSRDAQQSLQQELEEALPSATAVTLLPVVDGFSLDLEVSDVAPFSRTSFEPYVAEHVLQEAVSLRCQGIGTLEIQLLKSIYK